MKGEKKSQNDPKKKKKQSKENKTRLPFGLDESLEPATPPGGRAFLATERRTKRGKKKKERGGSSLSFRTAVIRSFVGGAPCPCSVAALCLASFRRSEPPFPVSVLQRIRGSLFPSKTKEKKKVGNRKNSRRASDLIGGKKTRVRGGGGLGNHNKGYGRPSSIRIVFAIRISIQDYFRIVHHHLFSLSTLNTYQKMGFEKGDAQKGAGLFKVSCPVLLLFDGGSKDVRFHCQRWKGCVRLWRDVNGQARSCRCLSLDLPFERMAAEDLLADRRSPPREPSSSYPIRVERTRQQKGKRQPSRGFDFVFVGPPGQTGCDAIVTFVLSGEFWPGWRAMRLHYLAERKNWDLWVFVFFFARQVLFLFR